MTALYSKELRNVKGKTWGLPGAPSALPALPRQGIP